MKWRAANEGWISDENIWPVHKNGGVHDCMNTMKLCPR